MKIIKLCSLCNPINDLLTEMVLKLLIDMEVQYQPNFFQR